jgi:hypothetical protein
MSKKVIKSAKNAPKIQFSRAQPVLLVDEVTNFLAHVGPPEHQEEHLLQPELREWRKKDYYNAIVDLGVLWT